MKSRKTIKFLISAVMIFTSLSCFILPFSDLSAKISNEKSNESQITSLSTPFENSLLSSRTTSVPAPSLTILTGGSSAHGLNKKHFYPAFLSDACSELTFYKFYLNESGQFALYPMQLHLAFRVLRI